MRRTKNRWTNTATVLVCVACLVAVASGAMAQETPDVGQVVQQRGVVIAMRGTQPRVLHLGASIYRGDRVVTDTDSKVEIEFRDRSSLSIGPMTEVVVSEYAPDERKNGIRGILTLFLGIIRMSLEKGWDNGFEVRTRAAVASVRSTDWVTETHADRSSVFVVAGEVAVTAVGVGDQVILSAGFGTDVETGGPSPPARWGSSRIEDVLARTRVP